MYNTYWASVCWKVVSTQDIGLEVGGGGIASEELLGVQGAREGGGGLGRVSWQPCSTCISHNDILDRDQFLLKGNSLLDPLSVYQFQSNLVFPDLRAGRDTAAQQPKGGVSSLPGQHAPFGPHPQPSPLPSQEIRTANAYFMPSALHRHVTSL